jgi:hypothetical protein
MELAFYTTPLNQSTGNDVQERLRIDRDGNVGIGTSNPGARLIDATNVGLEFTAQSNSRGFAFKTGLTPTEKMRINSSGFVGIGTTNPGRILEISSASPVIRLKDTDGTNQFGEVFQAGAGLYLDSRNNTTDGAIVFRGTGGGTANEFGRFSTSGRFGIGLTNPLDPLHVNGTANAKNFKATVYTITWSSSFALNPTNGETQFVVLGGNSTPTQSNWDNGESITLHIDDGSSRTITWTTLGVVWTGGSAPTLATSGDTVVQLWKAGNVIYGALVGEVA